MGRVPSKRSGLKLSKGVNGGRPDKSSHTDSLEQLDREDLVKMVKSMLGGGIVVGFNGKRTALEISKKVRPRVTRRVTDLHVGTPEAQSKNILRQRPAILKCPLNYINENLQL